MGGVGAGYMGLGLAGIDKVDAGDHYLSSELVDVEYGLRKQFVFES